MERSIPLYGRALVIVPFGQKKTPDGIEVDFDAIFASLFKPAIESAGLQVYRALGGQRGDSVRIDTFSEFLLADIVVADLTLDLPNLRYEIAVGLALKASPTVLTSALSERPPFDTGDQGILRYTLINGKLEETHRKKACGSLAELISAALGNSRERRPGPPSLGVLR